MNTKQLHPATRAFIHLDNFDYNIRTIRKKIGSHRKICLPVKANGYGHGIVEIAKRAQSKGVDFLAVALVSEGITLRRNGITIPVLLLNHVLPGEINEAIKNRLSFTVFREAYLNILSQKAKELNIIVSVHIKIDTGMHRVGIDAVEGFSLICKVAKNPQIKQEGIFTHFSSADSMAPEDIAYTKTQLEYFVKLLEQIKMEGIDPGIVHAANSGALATLPESFFDMVRPGIALYGYEPCEEALLGVRPLMELRSRIIDIKTIEKGESVSYGRKWTATQKTNIGVVPIGYGDGLNRHLSNRGNVYIENKSYPIIGRICMDQLLIDMGADILNRKIYDEVSILSPTGYSAGDMALDLNTIPYEVLCCINARVLRLYQE